MTVSGECPRCGFENAAFMNIGQNETVAVDCPPQRGCNFQAACDLDTALELIDDDEFPLQLK